MRPGRAGFGHLLAREIDKLAVRDEHVVLAVHPAHARYSDFAFAADVGKVCSPSAILGNDGFKKDLGQISEGSSLRAAYQDGMAPQLQQT